MAKKRETTEGWSIQKLTSLSMEDKLCDNMMRGMCDQRDGCIKFISTAYPNCRKVRVTAEER